MFRRRTQTKKSFLTLRPSNRGSDIVKPNNTSLIVNESDSETENLPRELTSIFSEDEMDDDDDVDRKTSSMMKSLIKKTQSTPLSQAASQKRLTRKYKSPLNKPETQRNMNKLIHSSNENSYFKEVLKAGGAVSLPGNSSFSMSYDQAVFSVKVNEKLNENPDNVKKFISSIREEIQDSDMLQKMLAHTLTDENCEVARGPIQEPMLRLLLNVDCLKEDLIELLLNLMSELVLDNKMESENVQTVSSLLHQMRFLNGIHDIKIASRLFEIIHVAPINIKREIIFLLPEIISEEETEEACTQLMDLLKFNETLTHVIVDAMTNFSLDRTLRTKVCSKVLSRLDKCPIEFLPSLVQFVLNKSYPEEFHDVINGLRNSLPFTPYHVQMKKGENKSNADEDSYVKLTFENLKFSVMASKEMTETWIKVISNLNSYTDFRCIDVAVLIIFYSCLFGRKGQILQLLRNKIKSEVLTAKHIQNLFEILTVITQEYCSPILEIASVLLKSIDSKICNFGSLFYKECFVHFHFYTRQIVISEILLHIGTGSSANINFALRTLKELCESNREDLSHHIVSVMGLLIKVQDLDLTQVRLLMDVISDLVFVESCAERTAAYDELMIFIRKQLISSKFEQCKKGVTAAVMFGKHSGKENDFQQLNSLLELAISSSSSSESKRGFFNDEFATMTRESQLSQSFLEYWSEKTFNFILENLFVKKSSCSFEDTDFPSAIQYSLPTENVEQLIFPISDLMTNKKDKISCNLSFSLVPSSFRLLWCLERNVRKTLPVFLASVVMPGRGIYEKFDNYDDPEKKMILDCLFLCCNYLIECINALCAYKYLDEALLRFKQLIDTRKLIAKTIPVMSDFTPPVCQFYAPTQKVVIKKKTSEKRVKKGKKRKIDEVAGEGSSSMMETSQTQATPASNSIENIDAEEQRLEKADLHNYADFFRELDFNTHKLLAFESSSREKLETSEVLFLLDDLLFKAEKIFKHSESIFHFKTKTNTLLIHRTTPENFIIASIKVLPQILNKIEVFSRNIENLLKASDWIYDSRGLFVENAGDVKIALAVGLNFIAEVISWKGFQDVSDKNFAELLSVLGSRKSFNSSEISTESAKSVPMKAAVYLASFSKTVLILSGALSIVKAFQVCLRHSSSEPNSLLADLCREFLTRKWFTANGTQEKGTAYNQHIDVLLKTFFSQSKSKLDAVRVTAKTALDEIGGLGGSDSSLKTFKTINKANFPLLYRILCEALVSGATTEFSKSNGDSEKQLEVWNKIIEILLVLVETAKIRPSRVILAALLKRSHSIIQLFLNKGMSLVESALRLKSVEILTLLKSFQMVTRFLHSICCQSRITNDSVIASHVPAIRSLCERLTLEVKGVLILNGIPMDCITIAILKNRDIKGNDIISQETLDENSDDESELPPEDTPDEEENLKDDNNDEAGQSDSEAY